MAGIAEALVATAVGLLVALPAVIAFNIFQGRVRRTMGRVDVMAHLILTASATRTPRIQARPKGPSPMAGAASQFEDDDSGRMITEINVTPLVDITLVLLIIFMVTTSYIVNPSIKVDLPKAATGSDQLRTTLALTLTKDGQLYLNGDRSDEAQVVKQIAADLPRTPICRPSSPPTKWFPTAVWFTSSIS